jgi:hypothetical protein
MLRTYILAPSMCLVDAAVLLHALAYTRLSEGLEKRTKRTNIVIM